ncbi:MAG: 30S ribosomal protein S9 [Phycisphaerales bacterium]|nr:30S ribosomal protein S9 [Phycisphaerales bacterium]
MDQNQNFDIENPAFGGAPRAAARPAAAAPNPEHVRPLRKAAEPKQGWWWGTGRRKTAVARVRMRPAQGEQGTVKVQRDSKNFVTIEEYFSEERDRSDCYAPLRATNTMGKMDVVVRVNGGGYMGQAGAILLGVSRALRAYDPTLEQALRDNGMLTRDSRDVERKKYGQSGARRRFQFSKR